MGSLFFPGVYVERVGWVCPPRLLSDALMSFVRVYSSENIQITFLQG